MARDTLTCLLGTDTIRNFSIKARVILIIVVMSVAAQHDTLNSTKPNAINCLIAEDPSVMFSIVKVARDQRVSGSLRISKLDLTLFYTSNWVGKLGSI